jgi:hypothetical protein
MLTAVIGSRPPELFALLARMEQPFLMVVDPDDPPTPQVPSHVERIPVTFKTDPTSVPRALHGRELDAVISLTELGQLPAALANEGLGFPGIPVATVLRTRDKLLMRRTLAGIVDQPAFGLATRGGGRHLPYPVVVKPVDSSGSRGIAYVDGVEAYERRLAQGDVCLWEEYLDGPEYSVEVVSRGGRHDVIGITAKLTTGTAGFVEHSHLAPAPLSAGAAASIRAAVGLCLDALGVRLGASHTELKLVDSRPYIVETHTRAGGDRIPLLHLLTSGRDQNAIALCALLGREAPPPGAPRLPCAGVRYFRWPPGLVERLGDVAAVRARPEIVELDLKVGPGSRVPAWRHSHDRPGCVVASGDSPEQVLGTLDEVEARLRPTYAAEARVAAAGYAGTSSGSR